MSDDARLQVVLEANITKLSAQLSKANQLMGLMASNAQKSADSANTAFGKVGMSSGQIQAQIELQMQLTQARAAGDAAAIQSLTDQLGLITQVNRLRATGLSETEAQSAAEASLNAVVEARAAASTAASEARAVEVAQAVRQIELENELLVARTAGDREQVAALEEQLLLNQQIAKYKALGIGENEAQTMAAAQVAALAVAEETAIGKAEGLGAALTSVFGRARVGLIEEGGAKIGVFGAALEKLGPIGLGVGAALLGVGLAVEQVDKAADYAENVEKTATALHMSTDAVQEWAFAFKVSSVDVQAGNGALQQFSVRLGEAEDNMKRSQRWFTGLGISAPQVKSFHDTGDALQTVVARIRELKDSSSQDAAIQGLGLEGMKNIILDSSTDLDGLFAKARDMGAVMDSGLVHTGADAKREFSELSQVIDVQLKSAFIDLAPALTKLLTFVADLARGIAGIVDQLSTVEHKSTAGLLAQREKLAYEASTKGISPHPDDVAIQKRDNAAIANIDAELATRHTADAVAPPTGNRSLVPVAGPVKKPPSDDNATALDAAEKAEIAAHKGLLEAILGQTPIFDDQTDQILAIAAIEAQQVDAERQAADDKAKKLLAEKHITQATYDQIVAKDAQVAADKKQVITLQTQQKVLEQNLAASAAILAHQETVRGLGDQYLQIEAGLSYTAAERKAIGQKILLLDQAMERQKVAQAEDEAIAAHHESESGKAEVLGALSDLQTAQQKQFDFDNLTPIEKWRDAAVKAAADVQTAMENVEVQGLDAFTDNLSQVISGTESLNQAWKNVYQTVVSAIAKMYIQKYITLPISKMLGLDDTAPMVAAMATGGTTAGASIGAGMTAAGAASATAIATAFTAAGAAVAAEIAAAMATGGALGGAGNLLGGGSGGGAGGFNVGDFSISNLIPDFAYASGTDDAHGGLSRLNEQGTEGYVPPGAQIIPNDVMRGLASMKVSKSSPQTIVLNVQASDYFDAIVDQRSAAQAGLVVQRAAPAIARGGAAYAAQLGRTAARNTLA